MITLQKAQYKHDCPNCKFLGISSDKQADLYACKTHLDVELIARYSDDPSDNASWEASMGGGNHHIREARHLLSKMGI